MREIFLLLLVDFAVNLAANDLRHFAMCLHSFEIYPLQPHKHVLHEFLRF
jgi:hypothetical protein